MKTRPLLILLAVLTLATVPVNATAAPTPASPRVGVYDSRLLSYAHFWSEPASRERDALVAEARAAKAAPDPDRFRKLNAQLNSAQKRSHLQVFSTAPADEAIAALRGQFPALQLELGVETIASRWDEAALAGVAESDRIDVTDRLVRELLPHPTEKQQKTLAALKKAKPLPLSEATKLADEGKL